MQQPHDSHAMPTIASSRRFPGLACKGSLPSSPEEPPPLHIDPALRNPQHQVNPHRREHPRLVLPWQLPGAPLRLRAQRRPLPPPGTWRDRQRPRGRHQSSLCPAWYSSSKYVAMCTCDITHTLCCCVCTCCSWVQGGSGVKQWPWARPLVCEGCRRSGSCFDSTHSPPREQPHPQSTGPLSPQMPPSAQTGSGGG